MLPTLISGFLLGILSSFHCIGMCGPLMLALPFRQTNRLPPILYHAGRIGIYTLGGLLFGLLGRPFLLAGWQQGLSITLGVSILVLFLLRRYYNAPATKFSNLLTRWITRLWQSPSTSSFFLLGLANGLLPCGMVYLAIAAALTRGTPVESILFMLFYGLGTLPLLLSTLWLGHNLTSGFRFQLRRALPLVTIAMALLLIFRGLNLGIPYLSPQLVALPQHPISCH